MRKTIFIGLLMIFTLSSTLAFAVTTDLKTADKTKTENKLTEAEIARLTKRVEEIRSTDKSNLSFSEKRALRKELKGIKENVKKNDGVIYISGGALLLIILIIILI